MCDAAVTAMKLVRVEEVVEEEIEEVISLCLL